MFEKHGFHGAAIDWNLICGMADANMEARNTYKRMGSAQDGVIDDDRGPERRMK